MMERSTANSIAIAARLLYPVNVAASHAELRVELATQDTGDYDDE
jgi:hypothetical protein